MNKEFIGYLKKAVRIISYAVVVSDLLKHLITLLEANDEKNGSSTISE